MGEPFARVAASYGRSCLDLRSALSTDQEIAEAMLDRAVESLRPAVLELLIIQINKVRG